MAIPLVGSARFPDSTLDLVMCSLPPEICADTIGWLAFMGGAVIGVLAMPYVIAASLLPILVVANLFGARLR